MTKELTPFYTERNKEVNYFVYRHPSGKHSSWSAVGIMLSKSIVITDIKCWFLQKVRGCSRQFEVQAKGEPLEGSI